MNGEGAVLMQTALFSVIASILPMESKMHAQNIYRQCQSGDFLTHRQCQSGDLLKINEYFYLVTYSDDL
jgi:hypothetical protein